MNAQAKLVENVEYIVRGADGKVKKIFQPWSWVSKLIKGGKISPLHPKIVGLFGYWANQMVVKNTVVTIGKATVAAQISGAVTMPVFQYIATGTGTGTPVGAAETALSAEITDSGLARGTSTSTTRTTTSVTNDTAQLVLSFSVTGSKAVTESGLFNHITVAQGTMLARQVFSAINVVNLDTLQITWKIQVS